ncbi:hypothetical protein IP78_01690 [Brevundimonas sp. AAP58]|jgi:plasmid stability protein|uniref:FitA-like ribbon-helix-helix domain-containing protein n=1 Tax=Brevundimonas sp. AAP58 TaxID=1523422 RepID=UPI0006B8E70C|nr:hypothetical protein [Brevundimonas sp. AAP58]KPF83866.1 hypothetical protein IP78_01690 [Brevundimonas sp. AAP58]
MPVNLHVRNVDDEVARRLKARAAANGRSAEAEHRALLDQALGSADKVEWMARADALRKAIADRNGGPLSPGSEVLIREDRDTR